MAMLCHTEYSSKKMTQLAKALLNLMLQHPYQDITVTDICREINVPRRTFYHYFSSKEDALDSMIEGLIQQWLLQVRFDIDQGKERMERSLSDAFRFWDNEKRTMLEVLIKNGLEARLITCASRWSRELQIGDIPNSLQDPKLAEISLLIGATDFFTLLFYWSRNGYQESPEQMARYAAWVLPHTFYK